MLLPGVAGAALCCRRAWPEPPAGSYLAGGEAEVAASCDAHGVAAASDERQWLITWENKVKRLDCVRGLLLLWPEPPVLSSGVAGAAGVLAGGEARRVL